MTASVTNRARLRSSFQPDRLQSGRKAKMTKRNSIYWISTVFVVLIMSVSGGLAICHARPFMKALTHLGYPSYFSNLLGIGKLIGLCVLLAPGLPRMKEWAYVAFGVTVLAACYSHYSSADGWLALEPLVTFAALVLSYRMRPDSRRLSDRAVL